MFSESVGTFWLALAFVNEEKPWHVSYETVFFQSHILREERKDGKREDLHHAERVG